MLLEEVYNELFLSDKYKFESNHISLEQNNLMNILLNKIRTQEFNLNSNNASSKKLQSNTSLSFTQEEKKSKNSFNTLFIKTNFKRIIIK